MPNLPDETISERPKMQFQMKPEHESQIKKYFHRTWTLLLISLLIIPINFIVWVNFSHSSETNWFFLSLATLQLVTGFAAAVFAIKYVHKQGKNRYLAIFFGIMGPLIGLGGPVGIFLDLMVRSIGGAWGRPLRVKGKILHPELRLGSDWTAGAQPDVADLDEDTKRALEALWLHDAQKEHASVPAFSRISWQLTAVGAPANLVELANRSAIQEIDHARRCFALAAGYGGRSHSVEPMPELLKGGLDTHGNPMIAMAVESLQDGCLLEDYNADVAKECFEICQDVAVKDVLKRITREERQHADFSWRMLEWLLIRGGAPVQQAIAQTIAGLKNVPRPTAVSAEKAPLVTKADPEKLRAHGRLEDSRWAQLWLERLASTEQAAQAMLENCRAKSLISGNANQCNESEDYSNAESLAPLVNRAAANGNVVRRF
jgi:hypothetical protein